jgi:hypothetical protein
VTVAVPALPEADVRAALQAEQWDLAFGLLEDHDRALRAALDGVDLATLSAGPWRDLLAQQTALLADLTVVRDETARTLARMGRERRGALAYRSLAG